MRLTPSLRRSQAGIVPRSSPSCGFGRTGLTWPEITLRSTSVRQVYFWSEPLKGRAIP